MDFLRKIQELNIVPLGFILATIDVVSDMTIYGIEQIKNRF